MILIHGTWIPDPTDDVVQRGAFYLWVETDRTDDRKDRTLVAAAGSRVVPTGGAWTAPRAAPARSRPGLRPRPATTERASGVAAHPRHLSGEALRAFLTEKAGLAALFDLKGSASQDVRSFVLPTANGAPLPAWELRRYVDAEIPDDFTLAPWEVACVRVAPVLPTLETLSYVALHAADEFQLGADLIFWHQFGRLVKQVVGKDQYLPSLTYHQLPSPNGKAGKNSTTFELQSGWEIVSPAYEAAIRRYAAAMPLVCAAGSASPTTELWSRVALLRHFAEVLVHRIVTETPFTAKHDQQLAGSILHACVYPDGPPTRAQDGLPALAEYKKWADWREKLTRAGTTSGFTLCFRLDEPSPEDPDAWPLRFLVVARHDPSLQLELSDYWALPIDLRADVARSFGPSFEKDLLLALGHAARVYPALWSGLETSEPIGLRLTLDDAYAFLKENAWVLEDAGFVVKVPAWFTPAGRRRAKIRLRTAAGKKSAAATGGYFSLDRLVAYQYQLMVGDEPVTEDEWRLLVAAKAPLVQFRGQWMELDRDKMRQMLELWKSRQQQEPTLSIPDLLKLAAEADGELEWDHDEALGAILSRLHDKTSLEAIGEVPGLNGSLREYQKRGVSWLRYLETLGLNPCLADDMGLGKTLEVIAHLLAERVEGAEVAPTLVIAPTSVLSNWRKEIERFAPGLRVAVHHGAGRAKGEAAVRAAYRDQDVVITSFALARLDEKLLRALEWRRVVVDEAQNIKNPEAAQTKAIAKIPAQRRVALTGTPVENRLLDLWSIFNFLNPGYLGKQTHFRKTFELPIQRDDDRERAAVLKKLVEPFILRRVKTDTTIIADLPEKVEAKQFCNLTPEQASLYAAVVKDVEEKLEHVEGIDRRGLILATLTKLKQVCNHPAQFLQDGSAFGRERSHKLQRLSEMVEEIIENGESVLVFTQYAEMGAALEEHVGRGQGYTTYYLHGGTPAHRREKMVAAFQDPESEPAVFILSLRAGGVGLNLTKANHVVHFDRWWNPAVEDQATDRAFRIGQRKNVFVHKFVAVGTLEERIDQMIEDKKRVAGAIIGADESWLADLDNESFKDLIALRKGAVLE